jgi:hypothetical protein
MKCEPDKDDPFSFEGPEIYKCKVINKILLKLIIQTAYAYLKVKIHLYF